MGIFVTAANMAFNDMVNYHKEMKIKVRDKNHDIWYVCPSHLISKETKALNRLLQVHRVNYGANKKNR
jgi:predicted RNase H-related nuclease YkuK (DUF458 family)